MGLQLPHALGISIGGLGLSLVTSFVRWRFPKIPNYISSPGISIGFCLMIFPFMANLRIGTAVATALALALLVFAFEWQQNGSHGKNTEVTKTVTPKIPVTLPSAVAVETIDKHGLSHHSVHSSSLDRSRYANPLKTFVSEGVQLKSYLQALEGQNLERKMQDVWIWNSKVGLWVCENMGEYALSKFVDVSSIQPRPVVAATPEAQSSVLLIESQLQNIQAMIERNTWDPHGAPILPKNGCQATVGNPDDPPAR